VKDSSYRSDTLLLAGINAAFYWWSYWGSGWEAPHFGTWVCQMGAVISLVPLPRELLSRKYRYAAMAGAVLTGAVLWHIATTPWVGPPK
jgi:hypothetical protein